MNNLHRPWVEKVLEIAERNCRTARGAHNSNALGALVCDLEADLQRLKCMLTQIRAIECAVERWHRSQPGHDHDRLEDEIARDVLHFKNRDHPTWTKETYALIQTFADRCFVAMAPTMPLR